MIETVIVALILGALVLVKDWQATQEQRAWAEERAELLQRIQAPQQAIVERAVKNEELVYPVPFDDDEEAFRAREQMNGRN